MRRTFGFLLVMHGLAHAGVGMWRAAPALHWPVTILWWLALVGFMTAGTVEYYAISDVLVLIFDNNDSPLSGLQPNPMRGKSLPQPRVRRISTSTRDRGRQPRIRAAVASMSPTTDATLDQKITERESDPVQRKAVLLDSAWPSSSR